MGHDRAMRHHLCSEALGVVISVTAWHSWPAYIQPMTKMNNRAAWIEGPSAQCETTPEPALVPWRLILLGAPGVGKGTQAELLHRPYGHVSFRPETFSGRLVAAPIATKVQL